MVLRRLYLIAILSAVTFAAWPARARAQAPAQPFVTSQLAPTIYWVSGGGGNSGIIIGTNGVIVVDAKTSADDGKRLLAEVAKVTPKPVVALIETHSDGDHVNGAAAFPAGIRIIAHENNLKEQQDALTAGGRGAPPADRLPTDVVKADKEDRTIEGVHLQLLHWAPAHTSGDLIVFLPDARIVFTGDIIATQRPDPLIHLEKHGSSDGWLTTARAISMLDADRFVPGHGDLQTKMDVARRYKDAMAKREKIAAMVKAGQSLDQIKAVVDLAPTPAAPSAGGRQGAPAAGAARGPQFASFTDVVYQELTKK